MTRNNIKPTSKHLAIEREMINEKKKSAVFTTFLLLAPSLFLAGICTWLGSIPVSVAAIATFIYQAIMLKNYVDKSQTY